MGMNGLNVRRVLANAAAVVTLVTLTFFLQAAFFLPRIICVMNGMRLLWNPSHSPDFIQESLYEGFDFLFALLAGILSMAGVRLLMPWAWRPIMIFGATSIIFLYSVLTILLHGRLPAYFFPIYLDLSAAIPGWLIGYYLAGGRETWDSFGFAKIASLAVPAFLVVAAVVIAPLYMPFYVAVQRPVLVGSPFHPVPIQQNSSASFTPLPPSHESDQMPTFHTVSTGAQADSTTPPENLRGNLLPAVKPLDKRAADTLPKSDICLMPIPGTGANVLGFALSSIIEAPKANGVLIDTVGGLFHQSMDGSIESLQPRTGQYGRTLVALPWSDEVFAAGVSETVVHQDLSVEEVFHQQWSNLIGVFPSTQSVILESNEVVGSNPFFGQTLSNGIEVINEVNGKYQLVAAKSGGFDYDPILSVDAPWFGTPIIWGDSGPVSIDRQGIIRKFEVENFNGGILDFAQQFFSVPRFQTLYVRMSYIQNGGWFRITPNRQWLPIKGLSKETIVFTNFDPGSGDALFATSAGIFTVSPDGVVHALMGDMAPRHSVYALAQDRDDEFVLAGGDDGLFRIRKNTLEVTSIPNGGADVIGSVKQIIPIKFANFDLIVTSIGTYTFEDGNLEAVPALAHSTGLSALSPVSVLPNIQRVVVGRRNDVGPMIYELRRPGPDGVCKLPLASSHP
jgi:hypothetical protein